MITSAPAAAGAPGGAPGGPGPRRPAGPELLRVGAAPVICAALLLGMLSAWVATGGADTISQVRIEITSASLVMPNAAPGTPDRAVTYLVLRNIGDADRLVSASVPGARSVWLVQHAGSQAGLGRPLPGLPVPARATVTLSPFGADIVVIGLPRLMMGQTVPLTLRFRDAGPVTVQATVTPPGAP
ncbi:MAG: copper chaperone PCu(A)C [Streptosporangiaceae bacterium]